MTAATVLWERQVRGPPERGQEGPRLRALAPEATPVPGVGLASSAEPGPQGCRADCWGLPLPTRAAWGSSFQRQLHGAEAF